MKKIIISAFMLLGLVFSSQAQDITKNAIGLRLENNNGFSGALSYQRGLSENNRLEVDLGWKNSNNVDKFKLAGLYQWIWNMDDGFNWYAGVGGGIGGWNYAYKGNKSNGTFLFGAGDIGLEYNFTEAPIQISLDLRPEFNFKSNKYIGNSYASNIGLGIRYKMD